MTQPFRIGPWTIEPALHRICGVDGEPRVVGHKVMAALLCLASHRGAVVSKEGLIEQVWDGAFTSDESLTTLIYELRKALDDSARQPRFIETIRKGGYRLMVAVEAVEAGSIGSVACPSPEVSAAEVPGPEAPGPLTTELPPDSDPASMPELGSAMAGRRWGSMALGALAMLMVAVLAWPVLRSDPPAAPPDASSQPIVASEPTPESYSASLAVLPLSSFGETCGEDGFAGGLTEMLVVDLAEVMPLEVLPSLATRALREPWNLSTVVSELEADLVLEGSVIRSGERLWLAVQLVDTASGRLLWGGSYERQVDDALTTQRDLAASITDEVRHIVEAASVAANRDGGGVWSPEASRRPIVPPSTAAGVPSGPN